MTGWPVAAPAWLAPWAIWRLQGAKTGERPASAPYRIPDFAWCVLFWINWRRAGGTGPRPSCAPTLIPRWAWGILTLVNGALKPAPAPAPAPVTAPTRLTWVECHGYYDPAQAQVGRMLDDAQRWHGWPNCVPMVGIDNDWPVSRYPELAGRPLVSWWRWEQITNFQQLAQYPGGYLWAADGFEAGAGDANTLANAAHAGRCRGVILQAGHAHRHDADTLRNTGLEVQLWASLEQISHADLAAAADEIRPTRFVAQIEGVGERQAFADCLNAGVLGSLPWDTVISGWGDFQAL